MNLLVQTLLLSIGIAFLCALPWYFRSIRNHSQTFLLMGTGALFGLCFFELLPEVIKLGGYVGLLIMLAVWGIYSALHIFHVGHPKHSAHEECHDAKEPHGVYFLLGSMFVHSFADGVVLVASYGVSQGVANSVFLALVAHKGYETLSVSSILNDRIQSRKALVRWVVLYALSLPIGVISASLAQYFFLSEKAATAHQALQNVAIVVMSIAIGSLLGCLVYDFMIPSFHHLRKEVRQVGWLLAGFLMTTAMVQFL